MVEWRYFSFDQIGKYHGFLAEFVVRMRSTSEENRDLQYIIEWQDIVMIDRGLPDIDLI